MLKIKKLELNERRMAMELISKHARALDSNDTITIYHSKNRNIKNMLYVCTLESRMEHTRWDVAIDPSEYPVYLSECHFEDDESLTVLLSLINTKSKIEFIPNKLPKVEGALAYRQILSGGNTHNIILIDNDLTVVWNNRNKLSEDFYFCGQFPVAVGYFTLDEVTITYYVLSSDGYLTDAGVEVLGPLDLALKSIYDDDVTHVSITTLELEETL